MSNIYEALQHANYDLRSMEKLDIVQDSYVSISSTKLQAPTMELEMIELHRQINLLLPDSPKMVLQFIGSHSGDGVSTIVREYASMATERLGRSVLILDANQGENDQKHCFHITNNFGWDQAVCDPESQNKAVSQLGDSNLYVSSLSRKSSAIFPYFDPGQLKNFFVGLRKSFDLVIIDSSSVSSSRDSTVLSQYVDGVLMVIEAEKTRGPVVENMKTKIKNSGGNILGLILNKRRYYIPEFLYRRL